MITKEEIRKNLPHGSLTTIAQKAGVTKSAVTRYFNDTIKSSPIIEKAALEVLLQYQKQRANLSKKIQNIL